MYEHSRDFLTRKGLPIDISGFREVDILDLVFHMEAEKTPAITIEELREIVGSRNTIAKTREYAVEREETHVSPPDRSRNHRFWLVFHVTVLVRRYSS